MIKKALAIGTVGMALLVGGVASPAEAATKFTLTVKLALDQDSADRVIASTKPEAVALCGSGIENQYGISRGTRVKVTDGNGRILALAPVTKINVTYIGPSVYDRPLWTCNYTAKMKVPKVPFYSVEVAGITGPDYTYQEIRNNMNRMDLIL